MEKIKNHFPTLAIFYDQLHLLVMDGFIRSRFLRWYFAITAILALSGTAGMAIAISQHYYRESDFSSILFGLLLVFVVLFGLSALGLIFASRMLHKASLIAAFFIVSQLGWLIILGGAAGALLIFQIESWMLVSMHLSSASAMAVVLVTCCFYLRAGYILNQKRDPDHSIKNYLADIQKKFHEAKPLSFAFVFLSILIIARSAVAGWFATSTPMMCDEASTYFLFSRSITNALTHYDAPNNHLLNSLLVFFSTQILGISSASIRFFPLLAGILTILACYALARKLFNEHVALISAALAASTSWMLYYSFQARGYGYLLLFAPLVILGLFQTFDLENRGRGWGLFVICFSLSFAAVPTTLFFWLSILVFGGFVILLRDRLDIRMPSSWPFEFLFAMGTLLVVAGIIYINPIFYLFQHGKLSSDFFSFPTIQPHSISELADQFFSLSIFGGVEIATQIKHWFGFVLLWGLAAGLAGLILRKRLIVIALFGSLFVTPLLLILFQKDLPFPRNLIYMVPLLLILSAYGLYECFWLVSVLFRRPISSQKPIHQKWLFAAVSILLFGVIFRYSVTDLARSFYIYHNDTWPAHQIANYLKLHASLEDGIVSGSCLDYMLAYEIEPQYTVTTVLNWWVSGTPASKRVYALPDNTVYHKASIEFVQRVCDGYTKQERLTTIGDRSIYLCEKP